MTAPPPGVDVKPLWRGRDFLRWGIVGAAGGAAVGLLIGMLLSALIGDGEPFDVSVLANWVGVSLVGVGLAWMPGSMRAASRSRSALYGTGDEVARLKYRVLRGRELELTAEETARGRYLARITFFSALGEVASAGAILAAVIVMRFADLFDAERRLLAVVTICFASVLLAGAVLFAIRRRANARRFLDETAHQEHASAS